MSIFKNSKDKVEENINDKKQFVSDMSYKIRNPLNAIYGISEIVTRNIREDANKEQILMYMEILNDAANELQKVVDECFAEFENPIVKKEELPVTEDDYSILKNLRVMVVEDSSVSQMVVKELLEGYGARITLCDDGQEAVNLFDNSIAGSFDVILMDIKMPIMDGYEATDKIRKSKHPQASTIPIIAMTAEAFAEDIQLALKSGMNTHVAKPVSLEKLVSAIKSNL